VAFNTNIYALLNISHCYCFSAVENRITLGRWRFDPKRGLRLECKKPQLADTELKLLGYSEMNTTGINFFLFLVFFIRLTYRLTY